MPEVPEAFVLFGKEGFHEGGFLIAGEFGQHGDGHERFRAEFWEIDGIGGDQEGAVIGLKRRCHKGIGSQGALSAVGEEVGDAEGAGENRGMAIRERGIVADEVFDRCGDVRGDLEAIEKSLDKLTVGNAEDLLSERGGRDVGLESEIENGGEFGREALAEADFGEVVA